MIWETIREGGSNEGAEGRAKDGIPGLAKGEAGNRGRSAPAWNRRPAF